MALQINALQAHELDYEISIRSMKPLGTVDQRRKILRGLLAQENANRSICQVSNPFEFDFDEKELVLSIASIKVKIVGFTGTSSDPSYKNISTRLWHVSGRLNRMNHTSDEETQRKNDLYVEILTLEGDLDAKVFPAASTPLDPNLGSVSFNANAVNQVVSKSVPVHKWGLQKFTGEGSLMAFLEKVETFRMSRGCSTDEVFASAGDLFDSQAWTWWYNHHKKGRFIDWDDLVGKLKETFLRNHYDRNLLEEIKARKQNPKEPVYLFISSMEGLFNRLTEAPSEKEVVDIIRENLMPDYVRTLALHDITAVSDLTSLCKRIENSLYVSNQYRPTTHRGNLMEPDLSRPGFSGNISSVYSSVVCWNCRKRGHINTECTAERSLYCYSCGKENFTKSNCPNCSKNVTRPGRKTNNPSVRSTKNSQKKENKKDSQ